MVFGETEALQIINGGFHHIGYRGRTSVADILLITI